MPKESPMPIAIGLAAIFVVSFVITSVAYKLAKPAHDRRTSVAQQCAEAGGVTIKAYRDDSWCLAAEAFINLKEAK